MKTTNATPNIQAGNTKGAGFQIKPGVPVPVSQLIEEAKANTPAEKIKEATEYPAPKIEVVPNEPTATTAPKAEPAKDTAPEKAPEPATEPEKAPEPAPAQTMALVKSRSRSEEIEFQVEKSAKLQLINTQLQSLKSKLTELKQFSFATEKDEDHRYARITIFDDNNREFVCKNHGLAAIVVDNLKALFEQKIDEKETELLTVSRS